MFRDSFFHNFAPTMCRLWPVAPYVRWRTAGSRVLFVPGDPVLTRGDGMWRRCHVRHWLWLVLSFELDETPMPKACSELKMRNVKTARKKKRASRRRERAQNLRLVDRPLAERCARRRCDWLPAEKPTVWWGGRRVAALKIIAGLCAAVCVCVYECIRFLSVYFFFFDFYSSHTSSSSTSSACSPPRPHGTRFWRGWASRSTQSHAAALRRNRKV